jgi:hypothetical protein
MQWKWKINRFQKNTHFLFLCLSAWPLSSSRYLCPWILLSICYSGTHLYLVFPFSLSLFGHAVVSRWHVRYTNMSFLLSFCFLRVKVFSKRFSSLDIVRYLSSHQIFLFFPSVIAFVLRVKVRVRSRLFLPSFSEYSYLDSISYYLLFFAPKKVQIS